MTKKATKTRVATAQDIPGIIRVVTSITQERLWMKFVPLKILNEDTELAGLIRERIDPSNEDYVVEVVDAIGKTGSPEIAAVAFWDVSAASDDGKPSKNPNCPQ